MSLTIKRPKAKIENVEVLPDGTIYVHTSLYFEDYSQGLHIKYNPNEFSSDLQLKQQIQNDIKTAWGKINNLRYLATENYQLGVDW